MSNVQIEMRACRPSTSPYMIASDPIQKILSNNFSQETQILPKIGQTHWEMPLFYNWLVVDDYSNLFILDVVFPTSEFIQTFSILLFLKNIQQSLI